MTELLKDDSAIDTIPLKLVVYLALVGVIIIFAAVGLKNAHPPVVLSEMERQLQLVGSSLELMQTGYARDLADPLAPDGNIRSFDLVLPNDLEYLSFGADPDPDNNGILTDTPKGLITEDGDVIYYKLKGDGKRIIELDGPVRIREGVLSKGRWVPNTVKGLQQAVVLTGGSQSITFELVTDSSGTYTLAHLTDGFNTYINTDRLRGLPYGLMVSVNPGSIPADGAAASRIGVLVIDNKGNQVSADRLTVSFTSTLGDLRNDQIVTSPAGSGSVLITSREPGTGLITARSPGLHDGTAEVSFTLPPVIIEFRQWISLNPKKDYPAELTAGFQTLHDGEYRSALTCWSGSGWFLSRRPVVRVEVDGMILGDTEIDSKSRTTVPFGNVLLPAGTHTLKVSLANDDFMPFLFVNDLYVEKIELY